MYTALLMYNVFMSCCCCLPIQLIDFRGKDKVSLLHYLIQELNRQRPELLDLPPQMESVVKASESEEFLTVCKTINYVLSLYMQSQLQALLLS